MGFIIIDEEKFKKNAERWNNLNYKQSAIMDLHSAEVTNYSCLLEILQQASEKIDTDIQKLEAKKNDIKLLMEYAK